MAVDGPSERPRHRVGAGTVYPVAGVAGYLVLAFVSLRWLDALLALPLVLVVSGSPWAATLRRPARDGWAWACLSVLISIGLAIVVVVVLAFCPGGFSREREALALAGVFLVGCAALWKTRVPRPVPRLHRDGAVRRRRSPIGAEVGVLVASAVIIVGVAVAVAVVSTNSDRAAHPVTSLSAVRVGPSSARVEVSTTETRLEMFELKVTSGAKAVSLRLVASEHKPWSRVVALDGRRGAQVSLDGPGISPAETVDVRSSGR